MMSDLIRLAIEPELLVVPLSVQSATADLRIANISTVVDQYTVEVEGLDLSWWNLAGDSPSLFPGDEVTLTLEVHTPVAQPAGRYPFRVIVASVSSPAEKTFVDSAVEIEGRPAVKSRPREQRVTGRKGRFHIETHNTGTVALWMNYAGYDTEDRCVLSFSPRELEVPPGEVRAAALDVKARRNGWLGERYVFSLRLTAVPSGHNDLRETLRAEFEHKPIFRSIRPVLLLLVLLAVIALVAVIVMLLGPGDVIDYFQNSFADDVRGRVSDLRGWMRSRLGGD